MQGNGSVLVYCKTQVALGNDLPGSIVCIEHLSPTRNYPITWDAPVNEADNNNNKNSFVL